MWLSQAGFRTPYIQYTLVILTLRLCSLLPKTTIFCSLFEVTGSMLATYHGSSSFQRRYCAKLLTGLYGLMQVRIEHVRLQQEG